MRQVYLLPQFAPDATGGVAAHLRALRKHLPAVGWEPVDRDTGDCLVHAHATASAAGCDVYTSHGTYPVTERMTNWQRRANETMYANLRTAREVIAVSRWTAAQWPPFIRRTPHVIGNGVDLDEWQAVPRGVWRARLRTDRPIVLWGKTGFSDVLDPGPAIELALRRPDIMVVIPAPAERLPTAPKNVRCVGSQPFAAMQQLLADCDVYLATVCENHSVQLLEALALGKPVLGYAWGGTAETLADAPEAGILVEPGDDEALADGLMRCLDPDVAQRMGEAGRQLVADRYQWRNVVQQIAEVYEAVWAEREAEARGPVCSIVIPVYNKAAYVAETLCSALRQVDALPYEVVVVDDGSTDGSLDVIRQTVGNNPGVTVISQANAGVAAARNRGITAARGRFICCLDADDLLDPRFLARTSAALLADPGLGIAYTDMHVFGQGERGEQLDHDVQCSEYDFERLKRHNFIPCANLFRKRAWQQAGGYKPEIDRYGPSWEDYELWLNMGKLGWYGRRVPGALFHYRKVYRQGRDYVSRGREHLLRGIVNRLHRDLYPPLVSVVIPCYRQAQFLPEALASVAAQTFPDWEVVVVDDGNEPEEMQRIATAVAEYPADAVRLVRLARNQGLAMARNVGCHEARGTWIVPLDADDLLEPTFLEETLQATGLDPKHFAYTDSILWWPETGRRQKLPAHDYDFTELLRRITWPCTIMVAKEAWRQVGGYKPAMSQAGGWEDWEFAISLGEIGVCGVRVAKPLFIYRQHSRQQMRYQAEANRDALRELMRRLHAAVYRGERPMGCCGNKTVSSPRVTERAMSQPANGNGTVLIRYVGPQIGTTVWIGPSGRAYPFGLAEPFQQVAAEDRAYFEARSDFQVVT